ncbi:hypothetical protein ADUPG1_013006 [Aduncisulcus paluster]|uniref:Integrase zinc-binding domain-containing protein n=1 Tax=Aduncisulcus paluster TaxID=2918883 RepID=A0ABQ5K211_9EUKA|nr:hypothetical protein ADUPG1_013006 [Aduncisulcus paluster]
MQYDYDIRHIKGKENITADTLSRLIGTNDVNRILIDDEEIRKLIKDAQEEAPPDPSTHEREGDLWTSISTGNIYIPEDKSLHLALIRHFHSATTGHHGIRATIDKLKDYGLTWTTMYIDVRKTMGSPQGSLTLISQGSDSSGQVDSRSGPLLPSGVEESSFEDLE